MLEEDVDPPSRGAATPGDRAGVRGFAAAQARALSGDDAAQLIQEVEDVFDIYVSDRREK